MSLDVVAGALTSVTLAEAFPAGQGPELGHWPAMLGRRSIPPTVAQVASFPLSMTRPVTESLARLDELPADHPWLRPVFLFAEPRSGSTLLLRVLNCFSGLTVWGEHAGIVRNLGAAYSLITGERSWSYIEQVRPAARALARQEPVPGGEFTAEWANPFDRDGLIRAFRNLLIELMTTDLPVDRRWGFKEIRYARPEHEFLRTLFPAAQLIVLTRDPAAALASQYSNFASEDPSALVNYLKRIVAFQRFVLGLTRASDPHLALDYSDLVRDPTQVIAELEGYLVSLPVRESLATVGLGKPASTRESPYASGGPEAIRESITQLFQAAGVTPEEELIKAAASEYAALRERADAPART